MSHTPGPWLVTDRKAYERGADVSASGGAHDICNCYPEDADLIAAAPDLLAALEAVAADLDDYSFSRTSIADQVRSAIAKATGAA